MVLPASHNFAAFLLIDSSIVRIFMTNFFAVIAIFILKIVHNRAIYTGENKTRLS